jgi:hypothetical protein
MSLVGNLEDLGLGDILQIVSLSRKSGVLSLYGRGREGRITFQNGQVIQATSSVFRENLGDLLLRKGLVDIETLRQALILQRQSVRPQRIGAILAAHFGVALPAMETIVKEQVEKIIFSFFGWTEGTFSFDVGDQDEPAATRFSPLQFMLEQGLNPQWLAMEGSRLLDEKRHRGESLEERSEEPAYDTDKLLGHLLVVPAADIPPALPPEIAASRPVPQLGEGVPACQQPAGEAARRLAAPLYDIGAELLRELGETDVAARGKGPESPGLHLLRGMLQELNNPALGGEIILLVLRFASELMNRAVIFLVKEKDIVGLGQFGLDFSGEMADARIRRMKIPRNEESVFSMALNEMSPMKLRPGPGQWDNYLKKQLGGDLPEQIFLGPIISEGTVVAILYGDNFPDKKPIGDTEALEIFLSQAGLAMEKALLERRLREKDSV